MPEDMFLHYMVGGGGGVVCVGEGVLGGGGGGERGRHIAYDGWTGLQILVLESLF